MSNSIRRIGVFTSGGDAPGMNAALRAVVRGAIYYEKEIFGIYRGYEGMMAGDIHQMDARSVANILQRGGTVLKSARSETFRTEVGRARAFQKLKAKNIDALIVIGGDGSFNGAHKLYQEHGMPYICIPGTIDNDIAGTDYTIGFDTATNTAVSAIDKIRDTALSHDRLFFIEVMGRDAGHIAINSGMAGGAASIIIPEERTSIDDLILTISKGAAEGKTSNLIVIAEGGKSGSAMEIAEKIKGKTSYFETKITILGHLQRGGSPSYFDRVLASKMGIGAIEFLLNGDTDSMIGLINNKIVSNRFDEIMDKKHTIDNESLRIAKILSI